MATANDFPISKENIEKYCDAIIALRDNLEALQFSQKDIVSLNHNSIHIMGKLMIYYIKFL